MITNWLLGLPPLLVYGVLFALVAGESAGLPLPGETSLIAVGALASQHGAISIEVVIAVTALAAVGGDNVGFVLGRHAGRRLLTRDGRWLERRRRFLVRGEAFFERHGPKAVFLARWLPGLRIVGAWLAGAHHMRWPHSFSGTRSAAWRGPCPSDSRRTCLVTWQRRSSAPSGWSASLSSSLPLRALAPGISCAGDDEKPL